MTERTTPVPIGNDPGFERIVVGPNMHSCGLTASGEAYCWGYNGQGQLGDGTTTNRAVPTAVIGGKLFTAIALGGVNGRSGLTCGIATDDATYCWGIYDPVAGIYTNGVQYPIEPTPTLVPGGVRLVSISAGALYVCGLDVTGLAYCWGQGPLGTSSTSASAEPVPVDGVSAFQHDRNGIRNCMWHYH